MFDELSEKHKKKFMVNSFVYFPLGVALGLFIFFFLMIKVFDVGLTVGVSLFVIVGNFTICTGIIYRYYRRLRKSSKSAVRE